MECFSRKPHQNPTFCSFFSTVCALSALNNVRFFTSIFPGGYQIWILVSPKLYKAVLYFPFALLLLLTRLIAGVLGFLIVSLLPRKSQKRSTILKGICKVLGIVVEVDDKYNDENAKLMVANHVSLLDRLAVNILVPCNTVSESVFTQIQFISL
ncbi:uncharacterized protein TNCV_5003151 [Trichonephila clavipes]|nr:uncharacterized protein TNCV_5003151 [Trichonephila clavipes]